MPILPLPSWLKFGMHSGAAIRHLEDEDAAPLLHVETLVRRLEAPQIDPLLIYDLYASSSFEVAYCR